MKIWDSVYICHWFLIWNRWSCLNYKFLTPDRFFNLKIYNFWILIDVPESEALCLFRNPGSGCWWLLQLMEKCRSRCWGLKLPASHIDQPEILLGSIKNLDGAIKSILIIWIDERSESRQGFRFPLVLSYRQIGALNSTFLY